MLGSVSEADDAVQEAWVRLDRRDPESAPSPDADLAVQRRVVHAFLAAARSGDFEGSSASWTRRSCSGPMPSGGAD